MDTLDAPKCGHSVTKQKKPAERELLTAGVVGESGFEPLKSTTTDLQSAPFGHSGTLPYKPLPVWLGMSMRLRLSASGAGERTRTPDLLITNQLLYQLSYTSGFFSARLL